MMANPEPVNIAPTEAPRTVTPAPNISAMRGISAVIAVAAVFEIVILIAAALGLIGAAGACLGHAVVLVGLLVWYWPRRAKPNLGAPALFALLATAVAGPFGAMGALLLPLFLRNTKETPALLSAWYDRIALSIESDDLTRQSDHVAIGRGANLAAPVPEAYAQLFTTGSIAARQAALGMIARHFHPDYVPALRLALASPDAIVRVQAAAVAARIRPELEARVKTLQSTLDNRHATTGEITRASDELHKCAASGLLSETDSARIRSAARQAVARAVTSIDNKRRRGTAVTMSKLEHHAYETHLMAENRYADLRQSRLARRDQFVRGYSWRPMATVTAAARLRAANRQRRFA